MNSLLENYDPKKVLNSQVDKIILHTALHYKNWLKSGPFDLGNTTSGAFRTIYQSGLSKED
jgi:hypothetical protein